MADAKISQLPVATSSAGTDVLPIVQSSTTKQLAIQNLVPQNLKSNATTGVLQVTGPAAGTTRVMTAPDANFTAARTDAAQSFTGDQTLATGNIIQGTAAKGLNFTANTPAAGKTSQLLNWYEEGTWTPTFTTAGGSGAPTYQYQTGCYTRIGNTVTFSLLVGISSKNTLSAGQICIAGLPFAPSATYVTVFPVWWANAGNDPYVHLIAAATNGFGFLLYGVLNSAFASSTSSGTAAYWANVSDSFLVRLSGVYYV